MLQAILFPLVRYVTLFNVFQYITFRAAYAAITSLALAFLLGPSLIALLRKYRARESIRDDVPKRHKEKSGTPTMGGILIIVSVIISTILWMDIQAEYTWIALGAFVAFGLVGFVDDLLKAYRPNSSGMSVWVKLLCQFCLSFAVVLVIYIGAGEHTTDLFIPFFKEPIFDLSLLYIPAAVILLMLTSNAVNLTDGLDGLAIGLVIMVTLTFAILAYLSGHFNFSEYLQIPFISTGGELAVLCLSIAGAGVGFLWFNSHPAEIMMGDTGSLSLGGVIGVIALMIKKEILLFIVGGVFMVEAISVILQVFVYKTRGKRLFLMAPIHHHFELKGWPETKVVNRLWILGGLCAILSLSTLKIQ